MLEAAGGPTFSELLGGGKPVHASWELLKWIIGVQDKHTFPAIMLGLIEGIPKLTPDKSKRLVSIGKKLQQEVHELLGDNGVLIVPTYPVEAPKHNMPLFPPVNFVHTAIWNIMEVPSTGTCTSHV